MPLVRLATLAYTVRRVTHRGRRLWARDGRAHVEFRDVPEDRFLPYTRALVRELESHRDIDRVDVEVHGGRLIVHYDDVWLSPDELVELLDEVERDLEVDTEPFDDSRPDHPGDTEPFLREATQLGADVAALGLATVGRSLRFVRLPRRLDLGWVVSSAENYPNVRSRIEDVLGRDTTDLVLGLANAVLQGLGQNLTSPVVDGVHRINLIGETLARQRAWERREPELTATPPPVPDGNNDADRPLPVPSGEVEEYAEHTWFASIGGLATSLAATQDLQRAATPILDAMPKAARLGRESFAARLDQVLASRGGVVMDPQALRRMDRIDTLVLPVDRLVDDHGEPRPGADRVLAAARELDIATVVIDPAHRGTGHLTATRTSRSHDLGAVIDRAQRQEQVCLAVAADTAAGLERADLGVGLLVPGRPAPWGADVILPDDLAHLLLLVRACGAARAVSHRSVWLALAGAGIGAGASLGGFTRTARHRVVQVVDTAALLAIIDGARSAAALADLPTTFDRAVPWHALPTEEVLDRVDSDPGGLTSVQVAGRRPDGPEQESARTLLLRSVVNEVANPLTPVLAAGAGLSLATGAVGDAAMVATVVALNAAVGGYQRFRTERAIADLDATERHRVTVRRDERPVEIHTDELVVGDLLELRAGEQVPADARIVHASGLEVDESSLTGESLPVSKSAESADAAVVAERTSMLYAGTSVAAGEVAAVVVAVGDDTESRRELAHVTRGPETGVEARLQSLTRLTVPMAIGSGAGTALAGFMRNLPSREIVDASVGLAVASVPEGLPLLATVAQLAAARRLSEKAVLVRNPRAIEALGRVDVLCADKTGTLTEGRLRLTVVSDGTTSVDLEDRSHVHERVLLTARRATPIRGDEPLPHPTDQAIAAGTRDAGIQREAGGTFEELDAVPFEPGRSFHAVLAHTDGQHVLAVKGAPEIVLERCATRATPDGGRRPFDDEARAEIEEEAERLAGRGLRVLAVAERPLERDDVEDRRVEDLVFLGLVGLSDPVRPVTADSVQQLREAGVDVIMITGDHPVTASGVAGQVGLDDGLLITGPEIDELTDQQLDDVLPKVTVCARVTPSHKVRIVRSLQRLERVVAVTGDGANDAPAIRLADVGIALGERATSAARDAADLVITEEKLEVIVDAIAEGRGLWTSVRDAVAVLLGGNVGEIGFTFLGTLVGRRPPLNARQLLLVNLLTDVAPAMAISVRPPTNGTTEALLASGPEEAMGEELDRAIMWRAIGTAAGATWAYGAARMTGSLTRAPTVSLVSLVGGQLGQTVASGLRDPKVLAAGVGSAAVLGAAIQTPGVSRVVGSRPLGPVAWGLGVTGAAIGTVVGVAGPHVEAWARSVRS